MGKIFESFKRAAPARPESPESNDPRPPEQPSRRRTERIHVRIPLFVYGYARDDEVPFYEDTCTIVINAHGALISMQTTVQPGQRLLVTNEGNERSQEGVVVSVGAKKRGGADVAFTFSAPIPQFWSNLEIGRRADPAGRPNRDPARARYIGCELLRQLFSCRVR
jgi:hypothetical protein